MAQYAEIFFDAASLQCINTNSAPLLLLDGTNVDTLVRAFDDTTEEYVNGKFQVPGDIDTSGTVTLRAYVTSESGGASDDVALTFGHVAKNGGEDYDAAYTDEDSGDKLVDDDAGDLTEITWTETVANLAWAANDIVFFRLSRPAAASDNLADDMYLFSFCIEIPITDA